MNGIMSMPIHLLSIHMTFKILCSLHKSSINIVQQIKYEKTNKTRGKFKKYEGILNELNVS